ncbi:hypothetical protein ALNOE001_05370 [Candidatus Methanobinarius endosymbioticus]|uniref:Methyltransferase type 11 domain-containing protein n=1 Tax=Candidatus Methanobinarius endosymbioticus TaxID=2006182 RepID=A0A366MES1_9EURY|nr:hypothetical protein ALNOE001_05370 [Candidatus Methanobinarius endosymbioticus]
MCHDLNEKLPFNDNGFDMILSSLAIHYLKNLESVFSGFQRILKPNSIFLFSTHQPFMNFKILDETNYFNKHIRRKTWIKGDENPVSVESEFYHRSLETIINTTTKFFNIDKILEPKPLDRFKIIDEKSYNYLNENPHILIIKAFNKKK